MNELTPYQQETIERIVNALESIAKSLSVTEPDSFRCSSFGFGCKNVVDKPGPCHEHQL